MSKVGKVGLIIGMVLLFGLLLYIIFGVLPSAFYVEVTPKDLESQSVKHSNYMIEKYLGDQLTDEDVKSLFTIIEVAERTSRAPTGVRASVNFDEEGITSKGEIKAGVTYKATVESYDSNGFISLIKIVEN